LALNIKADETDRLAREVAELAGQSLTEAVHQALLERRERLLRLANRARDQEIDAIFDRAAAAARSCKADHRSDDEVVGYNDIGAFD
jgi:antitoxin VapB